MSHQPEITWNLMRQTLVDWLLQVHLHYNLLPETLWITVNIVDRFLSCRTVSLIKLQLVGITAMFIAAKYEETHFLSVREFVIMADNRYKQEEIIKGERIMLQALDFKVSQNCALYSWMHKIIQECSYEVQAGNLTKFLAEVTLLDYRFLTIKSGHVAAVSIYSARKMMGHAWVSRNTPRAFDLLNVSTLKNEGLVSSSGYSEGQLLQGFHLLVETLTELNFCGQYLYKKYGKVACTAVKWGKAFTETESGSLL